MYPSRLFLALAILFLGCQKKINKVEPNASNSAKELEARFFDIPFPIDILNCCCESANQISYSVKSSLSELVDFYNINFEINGWKKSDTFKSDAKAILIYKKPNKKVCLSLKQHNSYLDINLFYNS